MAPSHPTRSDNFEKDTSNEVISPFAHAEASVPVKQNSGGRIIFWSGIAVICVAIGAIAGFFLVGYLNDPYRTLEAFPVAKYLEDYRAVAGAKFRGELRVEADLGWKEDTGRLMLFSAKDDSRPIAVMIPAAVSKSLYFTKGQTYFAELEVKEGGLIYANSIRKN